MFLKFENKLHKKLSCEWLKQLHESVSPSRSRITSVTSALVISCLCHRNVLLLSGLPLSQLGPLNSLQNSTASIIDSPCYGASFHGLPLASSIISYPMPAPCTDLLSAAWKLHDCGRKSVSKQLLKWPLIICSGGGTIRKKLQRLNLCCFSLIIVVSH